MGLNCGLLHQALDISPGGDLDISPGGDLDISPVRALDISLSEPGRSPARAPLFSMECVCDAVWSECVLIGLNIWNICSPSTSKGLSVVE